MAADKSKTPKLFDPEALIEAQRRNFAAFTNAGNIVADGMRSYAGRQVAMMQESMSHLWNELQTSASKPTAGSPPTEQMERMRDAFEKVLAQVNDLGSTAQGADRGHGGAQRVRHQELRGAGGGGAGAGGPAGEGEGGVRFGQHRRPPRSSAR